MGVVMARKNTHPLDDGATTALHLLGKVRTKSGETAAQDFAKGMIMVSAGVLANGVGTASAVEYLRLAIASVTTTER
jgi:hypothetical protein